MARCCHRFLDKESHFFGRLFEKRLCRTAQNHFITTASLFNNLEIGEDVKLKVGHRIKLR